MRHLWTRRVNYMDANLYTVSTLFIWALAYKHSLVKALESPPSSFRIARFCDSPFDAQLMRGHHPTADRRPAGDTFRSFLPPAVGLVGMARGWAAPVGLPRYLPLGQKEEGLGVLRGLEGALEQRVFLQLRLDQVAIPPVHI
jgi:hypothetical protein